MAATRLVMRRLRDVLRLKYEAGLASGSADWRARAVFAADDKDPIFDASSDLLAEALGRLVELAGGGDLEARLLSFWHPPPYLAACSQGVRITGGAPS